MRLPTDLESLVQSQSGRWLITGVAGFIGSNLLQALLERNQAVRGLDNFSTGHRRNLEQVQQSVPPEDWARFELLEGDICDPAACRRACQNVRYVLHQAALGSVPGSIADPVGAHAANATGTLNMLLASRDRAARRFVYASSCAVYGNLDSLPLAEDQTGEPLSPYAATKSVNELYARALARCFDLHSIGLRYFNIFGPRQDPHGPYAAVIPQWISTLLRQERICIHGDGETTRDFCYVANVVQANIRAALTDHADALNRVYNVASGQSVSLNRLFALLCEQLKAERPGLKIHPPLHDEPRLGDIRHSEADLTAARQRLHYEPHYQLNQGLQEAMTWYQSNSQ